MPKLSDLNGTLAKALGTTENAISQYSRRAREAGLISQAGRGPGGAKMTYDDVVNLLIAVLGSEYAKDSAETIQTYRQLTLASRYRSRGKIELRPTADVENASLQEIDSLHYFPEVLEVILRRTIDGSLAKIVADFEGGNGVDDNVPALAIHISGPRPYARIELWKPKGEKHDGYRNTLQYVLPNPVEGIGGDRTITRSITHRTMLDLASLFGKDRP